jgi:hypothetical protein
MADPPSIVVKGLSEGRAILQVDGELLIYREGDRKRGILLRHADNRRADVEVDGRLVTLDLDHSIAETYSRPAQRGLKGGRLLWKEPLNNSAFRGTTRLTAAKIVDESDDRLAFEIEYYYDGGQGDEIELSVSAIRNGKAVEFFASEPNRLVKGSNGVGAEIAMRADAPLVYRTDAIEFGISWFSDGENQGYVAKKTLPFQKYWKRVRVR